MGQRNRGIGGEGWDSGNKLAVWEFGGEAERGGKAEINGRENSEFATNNKSDQTGNI